MKLPWRRPRPRSRGQAMVEFALILPILVLLLLLAVDFGRVFFGWVALNNSVRIGASTAGFHPEGWDGVGNPTIEANLRALYREEVLQDMQAINCSPAGGGSWSTADIPDPTFIDQDGNGDPYELGDHVSVAMTCHFSFLTPLVGAIMGDPMPISASAEFPVKAGLVAGVPVFQGTPDPSASAGPGLCTAPDTTDGDRVNDGQSEYLTEGFVGSYIVTRPPSGNYLIGSQDLVGGQEYSCSADLTVFPVAP